MDFKNIYKCFINILVGLVFIGFNIISKQSHAKDLSDLSILDKKSIYNSDAENSLSVGAEYIHMFAGAKSDWHNLFRKTQPGGNLYVGYNWPFIMLELGYSWTTRKSKELLLKANNRLFGILNNQDVVLSSNVRFRSTHIDFNFFANVSGEFDVVTSIGVGFARPHITVYCNNAASNMVPILANISGKTSFVPRAGLGFSYLFTAAFGMRCMWHFEKNSSVGLRTSPVGYSKPFKNSNILSFGFFGKI